MINILISIKKPYSDLILEGKKIFELRKNAPRLKQGDHVMLWLYESGKDGQRAIIGKCQMWFEILLRYIYTETALEMLKKDACVSEKHLRDYLPFYAWGVRDPERINLVSLADIGMKRPPQSWQYLTDEQSLILEDKVMKIGHR